MDWNIAVEYLLWNLFWTVFREIAKSSVRVTAWKMRGSGGFVNMAVVKISCAYSIFTSYVFLIPKNYTYPSRVLSND